LRVVRSTFLPTLTAALPQVFPGADDFSAASARRRHLRPIAVTPRA
jgi:hypothetical protein